MSFIEEFQAALEKGVRESGAPGAVAYVGRAGETLFASAVGDSRVKPDRAPASLSTVYDLASLTKVIATTTAVLQLRELDRLDLEQSASDYFPHTALSAITIEHLLTHSAGFKSANPFYKDVSLTDELIYRYVEEGIEFEPGMHHYSDAAYILLGRIVELASGRSFDAYCQDNIFARAGMSDTWFNPPESVRDRCAATEDSDWRGGVVQGQVHDENAFAIGGVSGHAGLFSTASDVAAFARALIRGELINARSFDDMVRMGRLPAHPSQGLGWEIDPWHDTVRGFLPGRTAFGHTGWTGTSLWIDPDTDIIAVLLANTPHPTRRRMRNGDLRNPFHKAIARAAYREHSNVHSGLDRLVRERFRSIEGKRIALLTNYAAVDQFGRSILDVLRLAHEPVRLQRIFTPEHGYTGDAEAGEQVSSSRFDRVPVVSLYGEQRAPTEAQLRDVDLLVVDLVDIGSRYYTYHCTMKRCMEVCEQTRTPVLILDRPNPIGGATLEGPVAEDTDSIVCCAAIPVRHGMTLGELALWYRAKHFPRLRVDVSELDGWRPELYFGQCALPWIPPSPNMPAPETALLYVGNCLFEGVNLNEGRGTDTPFEIVGAPWLEAEAVVARVPTELRTGIQLRSTRYTPRSLPGKSANPLYRDEECAGIAFTVTDRRFARPFACALGVIKAVHDQHPEQFAWDGQPSFDTLTGGVGIREAIEAGVTVSELLARHDSTLRAFDRSRPKLYVEVD